MNLQGNFGNFEIFREFSWRSNLAENVNKKHLYIALLKNERSVEEYVATLERLYGVLILARRHYLCRLHWLP